MRIISASRRTDIPAFYGDWFMNRITEGFAGYVNPFNNKKYIVSLKKEDVTSIVLWSKNFTPFIDNALLLRDKGYSLFFNYTITGLTKIFEPGAPSESESLETIKYLSNRFSPDHFNWRYDPIVVSDITDKDYHADKFESLCRSLAGSIKRCYISFPTPYGKVDRSFKNFIATTGISILNPDIKERIDLAETISVIGEKYGIRIYSCCGDYLAGKLIQKGSCIDGKILSSISGIDLSKLKVRPSRKECGCTESTDIGIYDSCPHGCIYCYANSNINTASSCYKKFLSDKEYSKSVFLGASKENSDKWMQEISESRQSANQDNSIQQILFK